MGELLPLNKSAGYFIKMRLSDILCSGFKNEALNFEKLNRTRIHLILFSPLFVMCFHKDRGGRNLFRAMKLLVTDYLAELFCGSGGLVLCM